ncbi:hypothetical protein SFRURICE_009872 [Spodoptera frugiperda]|nr:hypothetical protein SFRURICE_009872 [Spodoptera frugiperda]
MTTIVQNGDDDSFIILGTSPGSSLDMKCLENGLETGEKRFGEILDENVILKETLKQNNESMKEQFLLIASCQEDMMKTHVLHKEKFEETKGLVEKLRQENKKLKSEIARLAETEGKSLVSSETGESVVATNVADPAPSGPSSALEFVTSPDDDTINKLTSQLELVEKQRRQVIVENEKLTWQKESLEHIVDATSKERDDLKEKLKNAELLLSTKDTDHATEVNELNYMIQDLQAQLQSATNTYASISSEEVAKRDQLMHQLEGKITTLQAELKTAQLKILELETVKLEFTKLKSGVSEAIRIYKDQIQDLHIRLKEAATTVIFAANRKLLKANPPLTSVTGDHHGVQCVKKLILVIKQPTVVSLHHPKVDYQRMPN